MTLYKILQETYCFTKTNKKLEGIQTGCVHIFLIKVSKLCTVAKDAIFLLQANDVI